MISDTDRRDVARRLRHAWVSVPDANPIRHHLRVLCAIYEAVGFSDVESDAIDLFDRLADLIEPDHVGDSNKMVDRDALLALAEDVDEAAAMAVVMDASKGAKLLADLLRDIARRIREALGVKS